MSPSHLHRRAMGFSNRCNPAIRGISVVALVATLCMFMGCKPNYPRCKKDEHCLAHAEVCINGQCQECRDSIACLEKYPGEHRECVDGRCEAKAECHADLDCALQGHDLVCRNNRCVPECTHDGDCGPGRACLAQRCVAACQADVDCPAGHVCVGGHCEDATNKAVEAIHSSCRPTQPGEVVALRTVNFEFNRYDLTADAKEALNQAAMCIKQAPKSLRILVEGHCDERGTQEYNLALGEKRAQAVHKYLATLGADADILEVVSKGKNEPLCADGTDNCHDRNRRVQFMQRSGDR